MKQTVYNRYRSEIYRIGWRLQYRTKKIRKRENRFDLELAAPTFTDFSDTKVVIEQLLSTLSRQEQAILKKIYWEGLTEAEVARQLKISQQGVNKWKKKLIQRLSRTMNY